MTKKLDPVTKYRRALQRAQSTLEEDMEKALDARDAIVIPATEDCLKAQEKAKVRYVIAIERADKTYRQEVDNAS